MTIIDELCVILLIYYRLIVIIEKGTIYSKKIYTVSQLIPQPPAIGNASASNAFAILYSGDSNRTEHYSKTNIILYTVENRRTSRIVGGREWGGDTRETYAPPLRFYAAKKIKRAVK